MDQELAGPETQNWLLLSTWVVETASSSSSNYILRQRRSSLNMVRWTCFPTAAVATWTWTCWRTSWEAPVPGPAAPLLTSVTVLITADESGNWRRRGFFLRRAMAVLTIISLLPSSGALRVCMKILWSNFLATLEQGWVRWVHNLVAFFCHGGLCCRQG